MSNLLSSDEVRHQSNQVWNQFGESTWIPNAKKNTQLKHKNMNDLKHMGIGKFAVLCGMGSSLENNIESLKKYRDKVDVICCDKAFGPLYDHGIKANYVVVADASIPFKYIENYIPHTENVSLFATPYSNPEWTHAWKGDIYFYVNQDSIESERIFKPIMGENIRIIPASSNVSNAMVVLMTNCENKKNENWAGYESYLLLGYDYSWPIKGNYYAWSNPSPKRNYMNHRTLLDMANDVCLTSENLLFSCKWLFSYVTTFNLPVINCSNRGILDIPQKAILENVLKNVKIDESIMKIIKNKFENWKSAMAVYKQAESDFFTSKEALIWQ